MKLKRLVAQQIHQARFPLGVRPVVQEKILYALRTIRVHQKTAKNLYCPKHGCLMGSRPPRLKSGRPDLSREITYLGSVLNTPSPFFRFAEPILNSVHIYNALDNLNKYRRYVKRVSKIVDRRRSLTVKNPK
jgi:hypothetical protein